MGNLKVRGMKQKFGKRCWASLLWAICATADISYGQVVDNYFGDGSDGNAVINSTTLLPVDIDGEMIVKNYESLYIGPNGSLKPANRNRGMLLYVRGDLTVEGEISMTARGASGSPDSFGVGSNGIRIVRRAPGGTNTQTVSDFSGAGAAAIAAEANQAAVTEESRAFWVARQGATGGVGVTSSSGNAAGNPGSSGPNKTGGGGSGGGRNSGSPSGSGSYGSCFSGGSGGSANYSAQGGGISAQPWGGYGGNAPFTGSSYDRSIGGGAGNPGGMGLISSGLTSNAPYAGTNGTGGLLILVVQGNVNIASGGRITANGVSGGIGTLTYERSGGASGGGAILLLYAGALTNVGTIQAVGGTNLPNTSAGGKGGDGWVDIGQIYPARPSRVVVGRVTDAQTGVGLQGIQLNFTDEGSVISGADGWYTNKVGDGWSGTITPSYSCGTFTPSLRVYTNVVEGVSNANFSLQGLAVPGAFSLVAPGTNDVARGAMTLSWQTSTCAAVYDVYVGTTGAPALQATVSATSWSQPISSNGVYSWYVVARNALGTNRAPASGTWSFNGYESIIPDNWVLRRAVVVSNQTASALTDYPVQVSVGYEKDIQTNFANIRFRDATCSTQLAFWVESYVAASNANVWVKVPFLPASGVATVYLCYGRADTMSASDGLKTFPFFDDFTNANVRSEWTFWNPGGDDSYSLTNRPGWLRLKISSYSDAWTGVNTAPFLYIPLSAATNYAIQARVDASNVGGSRMQMLAWIRSLATGSGNKGYWGAYGSPTALYYESDGTGGNSFTASSALQILRYRKVVGTVYYDYSPDGVVWNAVGSHVPSSTPDYWGIGGKAWSSSALDIDYDYFFVRPLAGTEPSVNVGSAELFSDELFAIAGRVAQGGVGLEGISLKISGYGSVLTTNDGAYSALVRSGWSGTVTPVYVCGEFNPTQQVYLSVSNDWAERDFAVQGLGFPGSFELQSPASGSLARAVAKLRWSATSCAAAYDIFVGIDGDPVLLTTVNTNAYDLPLTQAGHYFWFVVARNAAGATRAPSVGSWDFLAATNKLWKYRRAISLSPATPMTGYQVRVTFPSNSFDYGSADSLGRDLRFSQADGSVLPHWVESWNTNGTSAVWVQVRDAGVTNIFVQYGGDDVENAGSGEATFEFFDDFSAASIDGSKWIQTDSTGWSITNGLLRGTNSSGRLTSQVTFSGGYAVATKARTTVIASNGQMLSGFYRSSGDAAGLLIHPGTFYNRLDGTWNSIVSSLTGIDFILTVAARTNSQVDMRIVYASTDAIYYNASGLGNVVSGEPVVLGRRYDDSSSYFNQNYDTTWDWVLVRKYSTTEPVATLGSKEVLISGRVTDSAGDGVDGFRLLFTPSGGLVWTKPAGWYENYVMQGWLGIITPAGSCGELEPPNREYLTALSVAQTNQDFVATSLSLPGAFNLLEPSSGDVARVTMTLRWEESSCASSYDVYVGTNGTPVWQATVTTNTWSQPIAADATYSWYVVAHNAAGSTRSPASGSWTVRAYSSEIPDGWMKRYPLVVTNSNATALDGFPVRVVVPFATDMQADFGNIRFRDDAYSSELPYWIESCVTGQSAVVWVRMPYLPPTGVATAYLCYGRAPAVSTSDGAATFTFFDDFNGASLASGWTFWNPGGDDSYSLSDRPGWLRLKATAGSDAWQSVNTAPFLYMSLSTLTNYVVQVRVDESAVVGSTHQILAWIRSFSTGSGNKGYFGAYGSPTAVRYEYDGTTGSSITMTSAVHYLRYRKAGSLVYYDSSHDGATWSGVGSHTPASIPPYWGLGAKAWSSSPLNADYDYYFVRKYAAVEPVTRLDAGELFPEKTYAVSGRVTQQGTGAGLDGVFLKFSGAGEFETSAGGYYTGWVGLGWSGTVTPTHACGTLTPSMRSYREQTNDVANQDYEVSGLVAPSTFSLQAPAQDSPAYGEARLQWEAASCASVYDVYVGPEGNPQLAATVRTNTWTFTIPTSARYEWYVVVRNALGSQRAPSAGTWNFVGYPRTTIEGNLTLSAGDTNYNQYVLVKQGGVLTIAGPHTFAGLILTNGATMTHPASTTSAVYSLDITVLGPAVISSNSAIDVSGRGYPAGRTTGLQAHGFSGGSYGGLGADWSRTNNPLYGDVRDPNEPGSGGSSGAGGGLVRMRADTLVLDGGIIANGAAAAVGGYGGGGSGGGVFLDVNEIGGVGKIEARGGARSTYGGAGGGGGRIALYYETLSGFDSTNRVDASGTGAAPGSAGTFYMQADGAPGEWVLDSRGVTSAPPAVLWLPSGEFYEETIALRGSNLVAESWTANLAPTQLVLRSGSRLTFRANATSLLERLELGVPGLVQIDSGAAIDVSGKGYPKGYTRGYLSIGASSANAGGSYGGRGGDGSGLATATYGDLRNPNDCGSGAGTNANGGAGGGVVRITAREIRLNGSILANGNGGAGNGGAGGAGGGVYVDTLLLSGTGTVSASGGAGVSSGDGGGGGGRIALYASAISNFSIADLHAEVGSIGSGAGHSGQSGTIYISNSVAPVMVLKMAPSGGTPGPVSNLLVTVGNPLRAGTLGLDDLALSGPSGSISLSGVEQLDAFTYRVNLSSTQSAPGNYWLFIGTNVESILGARPTGTLTNGFAIDTSPPPAPVVTNYLALPTTNGLRTTSIVLRGAVEKDAAVWRDDTQLTLAGGTTWQASLTLTQGVNEVRLYAVDTAGLRSPTNTWIFLADTVAPVVSSVVPANGVVLNVKPDTVRVSYTENTSGIDLQRSALVVKRGVVQVPGSVALNGTNLVFTPAGAFLDGSFTVAASVADGVGNTGTFSSAFSVDTTPPGIPVVDPVISPTSIQQLTLRGTVWDAGDLVRIFRDTNLLTTLNQPAWSYAVTLNQGSNVFQFIARDAAGNESLPTNVVVVFDDQAPGPVTVTGNVQGTGTDISLGWEEYDEAANGADIAKYEIYRADQAFSLVSEAMKLGEQPGGRKYFRDTGLARNTTYFYAVVARDNAGLALSNVTSVALAPVDATAPSNPNSASFLCGRTNLTVVWVAPGNADGDLAGFRVYVTNETSGALVPYVPVDPPATSVHQYARGGFTNSSRYRFRITSFDETGNESAGLVVTGYTLLPNPTPLTVTPQDGFAQLVWPAVAPTSYVKRYDLYVATNSFASVSGMSVRASATATNGTVSGLLNEVPHYFAVVTVNQSGGFDPQVTPATGTPTLDVQGPEIVKLLWNGLSLGAPLTAPGRFGIQARDSSGVSSAEILVGGAPLSVELLSTTNFSAFWNIAGTATDGIYGLEARVSDARGNTTVVATNVQVQLAPPIAPVITQPIGTSRVTRSYQQVAGTGALYAADIVLSLNGTPVYTGSVSYLGAFSSTLDLVEGTNRIRAAAVNRAGIGTYSAPVTVIRDSSVPSAPINVSATALTDGVIRVSWSAPIGVQVRGYEVYRSRTPFTNLADATRLNSSLFSATAYSDLTTEDREYFYRVTVVNDVGSTSEPSAQVSALADRAAPRVLVVAYSNEGPSIPAEERHGRGRLRMLLTMSEPLQTIPFFSLTPFNGTPQPIALTRLDDVSYEGSFLITSNTPCGVAQAIFSGRDMAGNRGTVIEDGSVVTLDACGPALASLQVTPGEPIANFSQAAVTVTVVAAYQPGDPPVQTPVLQWNLSATHLARTNVVLSPLTAGSWWGQFVLPSTAGVPVENLQFFQSALDDLGNESTEIVGPSRFQVYQGSLPPLAYPLGLTATPKPGGYVELNWQAVEGAAGYAIFRGSTPVGLSFITNAAATPLYGEQRGDSTNWYAVASIRMANGQSVTGAPCEAVSAVADATPPTAASNLVLKLYANGLGITWEGATGDGIRYALYRDAYDFDSVDWLAPMTTNIPTTTAADYRPMVGSVFYAVVASDPAGNLSAVSPRAYTNLALLPVNSLRALKVEGAYPSVSWSHINSAGIDRYHMYLGASGEEWLVTSDLTRYSTSYLDTGYTEGERRYTVTAVDDQGTNRVESLPRSIPLPDLRVNLRTNLIRRGVMNGLVFDVDNAGALLVTNARLKITLAGREHLSELFDLAAGGAAVTRVVVGGYTNLPNTAVMTNRIVWEPGPNETVTVQRRQSVSVGNGMMIADVLNDELIRGVSADVRFSLQNTSDENVEIVLATSGGQSASPEVRIKLIDAESGIVLAQVSPRQVLGDLVVTLPNGQTVARIPPGDTFLSAPLSLSVPAETAASVLLKLEIDRLHYRLGDPEHVEISGLQQTRALTLSDTPYFAEVTNVTPSVAYAVTNFLLQGRAVRRSDQTPMPNVSVTLVIAREGFERSFSLFTDSSGQWSYSFRPSDSEIGRFTAWAVHPTVVAKPVQAEFFLSRVQLSPLEVQLNLPYSYEQIFSVDLTPSRGAVLTNVHFEAVAADQPGGAWPAGLVVNYTTRVAVATGGQTTRLSLSLQASPSAVSTGSVVLRLMSDGGPASGWNALTIRYSLHSASPSLQWSPNYVETGVAISNQASAEVLLRNAGYSSLNAVRLSLVTPQGGAAPAWVRLGSPAALGDLGVGNTSLVNIVFAPTNGVALGTYTYRLRVESDNYSPVEINLFATVDASGVGHALLHVLDIYTGTLNALGQPIQGLSGAKVRIEKEQGTALVQELTTDAYGEAWFRDLPVGSYLLRVTAAGHESYGGRLWVTPATTTSREVFLANTLVTVEWSVVPITIEDRYEVVLTAIFETDVPAAVITVSPSSVNLPENMAAGDVFQGELSIQNQGLLRADDLTFPEPTGADFLRIEWGRPIPTSLEPGEVLRVPYRVVHLGDSTATNSVSASSSTNDPCLVWSRGLRSVCSDVRYGFTCVNGRWTESKYNWCVVASQYGWVRKADCNNAPSGASDPFIVSIGEATSPAPSGAPPVTGLSVGEGSLGCAPRCEDDPCCPKVSVKP